MSPILFERHGLKDAHEVATGRVARTFPVQLPVLAVDRIYHRGFEVKTCSVLCNGVFRELSDHAAVSATLAFRPR